MAIATSRVGGGLAALLAAAVVAVPWYYVSRTLSAVEPVRSPAVPTGFVWAGRVFATQVTFRQWLGRRGVAYAVWAGHHPRAARHLPRR